MLRNIFTKTLRDNRVAVLIWGLGLSLIMLVAITQYPQFINGPVGQRAQQAAEMAKLFQAYSFMLGALVPLDTLGGFLTVRLLGIVPVMLSIWALVAGVGLLRGEEEPGILDVLLSTPHSRPAVFAQKAAGLAVALAGAVALLIGGLAVGAAAINESFGLDQLAATGLNMFTITLFWAAAALLVGQLVSTRRGGWAVVGTLMAGTYVLNNIFESVADLKSLAWLLPFHYYSLSKPLAPGRTLDLGAWLALTILTGVLLALAAWLFTHRDLGAAFALWPARASAAPVRGGSLALLGSVFAKNSRDVILPTLGWGIGIGLYAAIIVGTAEASLKPMQDIVKSLPALGNVYGNLATYESFLSAGLFLELPLFLALFGLTLVWGWANDEEEGRLELLTAQPLPRPQILLARYLAATLAVLGIVALVGAFTLGTAALVAIPLDGGRVLAGLVAVLPLPLVVLAFGLALATWLARPGPAVAITGAVIAVMYFLDVLAQAFAWPEAVRNLSLFHLYGQPVVTGVAWGNFALLVAIGLALAAASLAGFQRRDIAK